MYNVIRNPQGAYISILKVNVQLPHRVFLVILSEYLALKYGPKVVYIDPGDFLVTGYIHIGGGVVALVYPLVFLGFLCVKFLDCPRVYPWLLLVTA